MHACACRWGGNYIFKHQAGGHPRKSINPMVLFDYRCYVPGGKIGTDYDPKVGQTGVSQQWPSVR